MKLKAITINFESLEAFLDKVDRAIKGESTIATDPENTLFFSSEEHFKKSFTQNKIDILHTISKEGPDSIYKLALILDREHHHVVKDCRSLENLGLITLKEAETTKKQYIPKLVFEYDIIKINSRNIEYIAISSKCNKAIAKLIA